MGGKIVTTAPDAFKRIVLKVLPIIKAKGTKPGIIIPPLPRYLFMRCCNDPDHCINASEKNCSHVLLSKVIQVRHDLIRQLVSSGLTNFKVMDLC